MFDAAVFVWGAASAATLVPGGVHDVQGGPWPRWLDVLNAAAIVTAAVALLVAGWARLRLRRLQVITEDERTAQTHLRSCGAALVGVLVAQLPFLFHVEVPSVAHAKFTAAAALAAYGATRLWLNRDA